MVISEAPKFVELQSALLTLRVKCADSYPLSVNYVAERLGPSFCDSDSRQFFSGVFFAF